MWSRVAPSNRVLAVAFSAVVVCFVLATGVSEWSAAGIHSAAQSISTNATPALVQLAEARKALRHLQVKINDYVDRTTGGAPPPSVQEIRHLQMNLHAALGEYETLPTYAGERDLWPALGEARAQLDQALDQALAQGSGKLSPAAMQALLAHLNRASDRVGFAIGRVREVNAEKSSELARRIEQLRTRSLVLALTLDAVSVLLTILMAALVWRAIRAYTTSLEQRASELEQFAGRVAHDVLSPLNAVSLALDAAGRMTDDPRAQDILARGRASLKRTKDIADGLLAFARSGAHPDPGARAEVARIIDGVVEDLHVVAAEHGVELRVEEATSCAVACSAGVLTSLVGNLVNNAIKFMGEATVRRVTVRVLDRGASVRVEVEDTGPGLPPGFRRRVFEPYIRAPGSEQPGIGLGLAIVKRVVQAHGGSVGVSPAARRGCLFWFELPRARPHAAPVAAAADPASQASQRA